jgi:fibronectin type 3 domain-containing protein/regulation of enolase protein 1 (concanavalin A-like superfamily)
VTNTGTASLSIASLVFGGTNGGEFSLASAVTTPTSIEPGATLTIPIKFTATAIGIRTGTLTINSNDPDSPATVVTLRGLGTAGEGGNLEPSLQRILDLYQIPVNVGDSTPDTTDIPSPPTSGDALDIERLRAVGGGAVTIEMLGHFANSVSPSSRFGYYTPGNVADRKQLFTVSQSNAQLIRPTVDGLLSFTPTGDFGLYAEFPAFSNRVVTSEKVFNTWDSNTARQQKVRFYPLKNADGSTVPNAYIFAFEEYEVSFDQNDIVGIIRNVTPVGAGPELGVINVDSVPFSDRLVFNRIRDTQVSDPANNYIPNTVHERSTLRLTNSGNQNLVVSDVSINNADFIVESGGGAFTLTPGQTRDIVIKFVYNRTGLGNEIRSGTLTVTSNDADEAVKTVQLSGLWQSYSENAPNGVSQEPTASTILQTFGYNINIGNLNTGGSAIRAGEEILSSAWFRADTGKPIGVRQLAAFHQQRSNTNSHIRWLEEGGTAIGNFIFQHLASDGQSLLPRLNNSNNPAYGEFSPPNIPIIWRVDSHWSEDSRNTNAANPAAFPYPDGGHAMRFYAAKDRSGNLIPNTYIMIHDYTGQSFSNYDYQDNIYILTNVRPKSGPSAPASLNLAATGAGLNLSWTGNTEGNLAGYNVYRSTSSNGTFTKVNAALVTTNSYSDTSALTGTTYYYQVRAVDVHGTEGANATTSGTRTSDTVPPAMPSNPTSVGSTGSIALNWLNNIEADLAGYNVYRASAPDGPFIKLNGSVLTSSDYTDLSAPVAAISYYRITAVDLTGNESAPALTDNYRPASGSVPTAPTSLTSTAIAATSVTLRWTDNSNNETGFLIERQNTDGSWSQIGSVGANINTHQATGLTSGTAYAFRVRAQNASGPSGYSNTYNVTTTLTAPAAPSSLGTTALSATAVRLTWTDNATNEAGYRIERQIGAGAWVSIDTVGTNITLYVDYSALPSTSYSYRVVAYNAAGSSSASNTSSVTTPSAQGYSSADIGNPIPAGSTNTIVSGRDYDITAGGTDIWANSDQFRFVYRQLTGDFDYSARITDISQVDVGSMAGLMARESLNADSRHVYMRARSSGMRFNYRETTGGISSGQGNATFTFPNAWVRLQRVGNVFTGLASTDGTNWTQVYQFTMNLPSTLYFGMAVSARTTNGQATVAKIRDLTDQKATVAPTAPTDLIGTSDTANGRVLLYWTNTAQNATNYRIDRRELGSDAWSTLTTLGSTATGYTDTTVTLGRSYVYRVVALNAAGENASTELVITHASGVPTAPSSLSATNGTNGIVLNWQDNASNETYYQLERKVGLGAWTSLAVISANLTTFTDNSISANTEYSYRIRALGDAGDSNYSNESTLTSPAALAFTSADIGITGGVTQTVETGSDYNVSAAGTDIWSTSDQFRFVYRQITGDFDLRVRVDSLSFVNAQSMAGLMARATLDGNSRNVFVKARADGTDRMTYRSSTGGATVGAGAGSVSYPNAWLRMTRVGNTFTTYSSANGTDWTFVAAVTLSLPATMYVGMAVSSHQTGVSTTAQFRDLTLTTT